MANLSERRAELHGVLLSEIGSLGFALQADKEGIYWVSERGEKRGWLAIREDGRVNVVALHWRVRGQIEDKIGEPKYRGVFAPFESKSPPIPDSEQPEPPPGVHTGKDLATRRREWLESDGAEVLERRPFHIGRVPGEVFLIRNGDGGFRVFKAEGDDPCAYDFRSGGPLRTLEHARAWAEENCATWLGDWTPGDAPAPAIQIGPRDDEGKDLATRRREWLEDHGYDVLEMRRYVDDKPGPRVRGVMYLIHRVGFYGLASFYGDFADPYFADHPPTKNREEAKAALDSTYKKGHHEKRQWAGDWTPVAPRSEPDRDAVPRWAEA